MIKEISIFIKPCIIRDLGFIPISKDFNNFYVCWFKWDHKKIKQLLITVTAFLLVEASVYTICVYREYYSKRNLLQVKATLVQFRP